MFRRDARKRNKPLKFRHKTINLFLFKIIFYHCKRLLDYINTTCIYIFTENLALYKPAYQQNPYKGHLSYITNASDAVNGLTLNLNDSGDHCILSAERERTATWWVNLTSILSIHHITIYYMTGRTEWGICLHQFQLK